MPGFMSGYKRYIPPSRKGRGTFTKTMRSRPVTAKQVDRQIVQHAEKKYHIESDNAAPISNTGTFIDLCEAAQGDQQTQRSGNRITPTSVAVGFAIENSEASNEAVRVIIFQWAQDDTVPPTLGEILEVPTAPNHVYSSYVQQQKTRFKILFDRRYDQTSGENSQFMTRKVLVTKGLKKIRYNPALETGYDKLYLVVMTTSGGSAHIYTHFSLVRYTDM